MIAVRLTALALFVGVLGVSACTPTSTVEPHTTPVPSVTGSASAPPSAPSDPAPVVDGDITVAYENGLRILVKRTPGAELAAIQLYIKGGVRNWSKADAGIELLALRTATSGGAGQLDKDAFSKKLSALGSDIGASSQNDDSVIEAKTLATAFDETMGLLVDTFLAPKMPDSEIEVGRQRQLTQIRRDDETPDGKLGLLATKALFSGHPYENRPVGTVESVSSLQSAGLLAHLAKLRETSRLELVVVGDVSADHVRELVRASLGKLPRGAYVSAPLPTPSFDRAKATLTDAKMPTNYVQSLYVGPGWHDPDFAAGILAMSVLGDRIWEEVRTKRNLSYAPNAGLRWGSEITRGTLYVTAVDPNAAIKVMFDEVERLKTDLVPDGDLKGVKSQFLTGHLTQNESSDGQASWLGMTDIVGGDYRLSRTLPERIKAVSPAEIQAYMKKRVQRLQTVVLGDASKIDQHLFESL